MLPDPPGGPLDAIHLAYVELTAKISAGVVSLDQALLQLQREEVVDAAGSTWRIDPVTQSFIRRAAGTGMSWRLADPSEFAFVAPPQVQAAPAARDIEIPADRARSGRVLIIPVVAVAAVAIAAGLHDHGGRHAAVRTFTPQVVAAPKATPTVTREAPTLAAPDLRRYQPTDVKAESASGQAVLTWRLSAQAQRDGLGIVVRSEPADGVTGLSRTGGDRLPQTYVAAPLEPGRRYCFLVGVLLRATGGATTLAQSGPVCVTSR